MKIPTRGWRRSHLSEAQYRKDGVSATAYVVDRVGTNELPDGASIVVAVAGDDPRPFATMVAYRGGPILQLSIMDAARCWLNARTWTGEHSAIGGTGPS